MKKNKKIRTLAVLSSTAIFASLVAVTGVKVANGNLINQMTETQSLNKRNTYASINNCTSLDDYIEQNFMSYDFVTISKSPLLDCGSLSEFGASAAITNEITYPECSVYDFTDLDYENYTYVMSDANCSNGAVQFFEGSMNKEKTAGGKYKGQLAIDNYIFPNGFSSDGATSKYFNRYSTYSNELINNVSLVLNDLAERDYLVFDDDVSGTISFTLMRFSKKDNLTNGVNKKSSQYQSLDDYINNNFKSYDFVTISKSPLLDCGSLSEFGASAAITNEITYPECSVYDFTDLDYENYTYVMSDANCGNGAVQFFEGSMNKEKTIGGKYKGSLAINQYVFPNAYNRNILSEYFTRDGLDFSDTTLVLNDLIGRDYLVFDDDLSGTISFTLMRFSKTNNLTNAVPPDKLSPVVSTNNYVITTNINDPFKLTYEYLKNYVSCIDETDGDITSKFVVESSNYNENSVGSYEVKLKWTDNGGNSASQTFNIIRQDTTAPTPAATPLTVGTKDNSLTDDQLLAAITATDNYYSSFTKTIVTNNYNGTTTPGKYTYTVKVQDGSGNYSTIVNTIQVNDNWAPIGTATPIVRGSSESVLSIDNLKAAIIWNDDVTPSNKLNYEVTYNTYNGTTNVGTYSYTIKATDAAGNSTSVTNTITINDTTAPVLQASALTVANNATALSDAQLKAAITASDNHSTTLTYEIIENNYKQLTTCGSYTYVIKVADEAGNSSTISNSVNVIDKTAPTIAGPATITTGHKMTETEILSQYTFKDETSATNKLVATYTDTTKDKVGSYEIVITLKDEAGNIATKTIEVNYIDDNAPVIYVSGLVKIEVGTKLTTYNLCRILETSAGITIKDTDTVSFTSTYFNNENVAGSYDVTAKVNDQEYKMTFETYEQTEVSTPKKENGFIRFLKKLWKYIKKIFKAIGKFFKWLWDHTLGKLFK